MINAPATVPELVILNVTAALVVNTDGLADVAELKVGVLRVPEYVGALALPTSNHVLWLACVSV